MNSLVLTPEEFRESMKDPRVRKAVRDELWYEGNLSGQLRPHGQLWIYNWLKEQYRKNPGPDPFVIETHRRLGKSHWGLMLSNECCIPKPGRRVVYGAPTKEMALPIVKPNMSKVLESCPIDLRPSMTKWSYSFRNPRWPRHSDHSILDIFGINSNPDAARGGYCDLAIIDEAGYVDDLKYFINEVMVWQFMGRESPMLILISTPPKSMDHPFITKYIPEAKAKGRHYILPASKNPDFTQTDEDYVLQVCGTKNSIAWKREAECEHITDPESLVVPEWQEAKKEIIRHEVRPTYYIPIICMDTGWSDFFHVLFGYVSFNHQRLIVLDEIWGHYMSEGQIVGLIKEKEEDVFPPDVKLKHKTRRIADATALTLNSFWVDHRMNFEQAQKHDADATLAGLRTNIQAEKVIISPDCQHLIYQLDNGIWNPRRTDFQRSETLGHCDGIKALAYMNRQAPWSVNPNPGKPHEKGKFYRDTKVQLREKRKKHPMVKAFKS
jgi:hypothetical protein